MIDTIKIGIPLTLSQHTKLRGLLLNDDSWQWVKLQLSTGELRFVRCRGLAKLDRQSFHRDIAWDINSIYSPERGFLILELSLPKFWYGHNIHLLYGFVEALELLKKILQKQFRCRFPDVMDWKVFRADCCYAWKCPSQHIAQQILDSIKHLSFPYKKPVIYPTSIVFVGTTYTVKFYLKLPEFIKHDRKELIKRNAPLEWINHLEGLSEGVLRYEATLKHRYLKRQGIEVVSDLAKSSDLFEWTPEFLELNQDVEENEYGYGLYIYIICAYLAGGGKDISEDEIMEALMLNPNFQFQEGLTYEAPSTTININGEAYNHKGGGFIYRKVNNPTLILQKFLNKFLGDNRTMQEADEVKIRLKQFYKPVKATRLMAVWLYVQKYGTQIAKEEFGRDSFDRAKREIKAAGCSFVEPPKTTNLQEEFMKTFKLDVPSLYVTNTVDDFRDTTNIINLIPHIIAKSKTNKENL